MADLTRLHEQITIVERQLAAMTSQAAEGGSARRMAARRAEIAKQQRYLDGLREALALVATDGPNQAVIEISAHPSIWATVLPLATTGQTADQASIKRGVNGGTIRLSEAAAWSADNDRAIAPTLQAVHAACQAKPHWRRCPEPRPERKGGPTRTNPGTDLGASRRRTGVHAVGAPPAIVGPAAPHPLWNQASSSSRSAGAAETAGTSSR